MKNIFPTIFILATAFLSCDQENIGALYVPENSYVAFSTSIVPENILSSDNNYSVLVQIVRSVLSDQSTANVSLEMNDDIEGVFALESNTVTFADGEGVAYAKVVPVVAPELINPAKTYTFNLTLTGDNVSELYNNTTYVAFFDIEYIAAGTGNLISNFDGEERAVEILKADFGNNITAYKAQGLYQEGYDIVIVVSGENVTVAGQAAWYYDDEYGEVYIIGSGTANGKELTLSLTHYIPDVYAWDPETEILILP